MNTKSFVALLLPTLVLTAALIQGCGKKANNGAEAAQDESPVASVLADNPNARISDVLQKLRGRWVKEIPDPNKPNPAMMRLFAVADNTLQGRLLFAGAFDDTGVAALLKQDGDVFTLTLTDDELRPHDWIPKERVFTGAYNATDKALELKSREGEFMKFDYTDPKPYTVKFSGNVYHCVVVPVATGSSGSSGSGSTTGGTTTTTPSTTPSSDSGSSGGGGILDRIFGRSHLEQVVPTAELQMAANPTPRPGTPPARLASCGVFPFWEEEWSRMSGAGF